MPASWQEFQIVGKGVYGIPGTTRQDCNHTLLHITPVLAQRIEQTFLAHTVANNIVVFGVVYRVKL